MTMTAESYVDRVLDALPRATPRREQIAIELRGHIAERRAAGQTEADVLRQLGDPLVLAESYLTAVPLVSASFLGRAVAKVIDVMVVLVGLVPFVGLAWVELPPEIAPFALLAGIVAASWAFAIYTVLGELKVGQTLGKYLCGLRVVRESGARIGLGQAIVRQLPMFLEIFIIDVLFALFTEKHQRAFELLSKTRVVVAET
jgi:uncharacterized RDD family membrane protein YckC